MELAPRHVHLLAPVEPLVGAELRVEGAVLEPPQAQREARPELLEPRDDFFFPFVDGIEKLVQSGVKAVIQPYGSVKDKEIINFANETNTELLFSTTRHFRH